MPRPSDTTDTRDIHTWFGLTYSNYLVLHRSLLQSMPDDWQHEFVTLLEDLHRAFAGVEQPECFAVQAGTEREIEDLTDAERKLLGITGPHAPDGDLGRHTDESDDVYFYRGEEYRPGDVVVVPTRDPVPHYRRGRTRVPLAEGWRSEPR